MDAIDRQAAASPTLSSPALASDPELRRLRIGVWHLGEEALRQIHSDPPECDPTFPWAFDGAGDDLKIQRIQDLMEKGLYVKAATVTMVDLPLREALGLAYIATSSIEQPWYAPSAVDRGYDIDPTGWSKKSTSIGDIVMTSDNRILACGSLGWRHVGPAPEMMLELDGALGLAAARAQKSTPGPSNSGMSV